MKACFFDLEIGKKLPVIELTASKAEFNKNGFASMKNETPQENLTILESDLLKTRP